MKRLSTAAAAIMLLAGCGATGPGPAVPPTVTNSLITNSPVTADGGFNATDVMFLQMMLAQYAPAAEILKLAGSRAANEQIRTLAAAIDVTQAEESAAIRAWLTGWGQPSEPDARPEPHAGHGGLPATGEAEIEALRKAPDADFDRTFLNLLIGRQHQAVEYARMELATGANAAALALATRIDQSRTAQIQLMLKLVGQRPTPSPT